MTFTPRPHAAWNALPPLRSGLAAERAGKGTLGAAISLPLGTYFTCARHVAGERGAAPESMSVYRFYPIGLNFTIARYLSLNALLLLERTTELAPGYSAGDVFSGKADDVPVTNQISPGLALGVGMDPTLLGDLVGQIVKAGL